MRGLRFSGKVALVTGASRGIGLATARVFVAEGGRVCVTARHEEALEKAVVGLGGPELASSARGKADDPEHIEQAVQETLARFGRIDVLVNNAGINPAHGPMTEVDIGAARKVFDVNVLAALQWAQEVHKAWMSEHGGVIVNIASVAGLAPAEGIGLYGASKAALIHLTEQLAWELAPTIRVNAVAPAVVRTTFAAPLYEAKEEEVTGQYPLGRLGDPDDVAQAVAFLASAEASWVTGHTLVVDGGLSMRGGV